MRFIPCILLLCIAAPLGSFAETDSNREWRTRFTYGFNEVEHQLVLIACQGPHGKRNGNGFVAEMEGKTYIFTNQRILFGADKISFKTASGEVLRPKRVELSMTRDIARLEIDTDRALAIRHEVKMGTPVAVFGKSENADAATELHGAVNGVGAELIETSAEFGADHSGSPVLNLDREVIGIAAYVRVSRDHAMKEGTKFENQTRRFCYRLNGVRWKSVNWKRYNDEYGAFYRQSERMTDGIFGILREWGETPLARISMDDTPERALASWAKSHNEVVSKFTRDPRNKRSVMTEYSASLEKLADSCRGRARQLLLFSEQRELTGFLRDAFERQAALLEYAANVIDRCGDLIYNYRD